MKPSTLRRGMNLWPPFLFSGIRVMEIGPDWRYARVELRQRFYNRNYVGVHFGGSIFAMTDPFFMLLAMNVLPRDYTVWDQEGHITFLSPGRGTLATRIEITDDMVAEVVAATPEQNDLVRPTWTCMVRDAAGTDVAKVDKTLHIRKRADRRQRIGD